MQAARRRENLQCAAGILRPLVAGYHGIFMVYPRHIH